MSKTKLLLLGILFALVACGPGEANEPMKQVQGGAVGNGISRYVDQEAGVVCWVYNNPFAEEAGIDCLPISETKLVVP